jgi:hypothetical protein
MEVQREAEARILRFYVNFSNFFIYYALRHLSSGSSATTVCVPRGEVSKSIS